MPIELTPDQRLFVNLHTSFYDQMNSQLYRLQEQINVLNNSMNHTRNSIQNIYIDARNTSDQRDEQQRTMHEPPMQEPPMQEPPMQEPPMQEPPMQEPDEPNEPHLPRMREVSLMVQETTRCLFSDIVQPLNTECPISLEPFEPNSEVVQINRCGHIFNRHELQHWFENNTRCPTCRTELRQQQTQTTDQIMTTLFYDLIFPTARRNNNHQT